MRRRLTTVYIHGARCIHTDCLTPLGDQIDGRRVPVSLERDEDQKSRKASNNEYNYNKEWF